MRVGSGEIEAEAEAPPMREVFASSVLAIDIFPEYVRITLCSDLGPVFAVLTPDAYRTLACRVAIGHRSKLH